MSQAPRQQQRQPQQGEQQTPNQQISTDQGAQARMKRLFELIRDRRPEIEAVLPADVDYGKFEAVVNMAIRREPRLLECYGPSFIAAAIRSAYDGLLPDGNQAVILHSNNKVPGTTNQFRLEARYQSMVYGIRLKLVQAGAVTFIDAKVVYSKEHFVHKEGLERVLEHTPILDAEKRGDPFAVYAMAILPDGSKVFDVMGKGEVEAAKNVAKTKNVWDGPFKFEMWKKTAIRRLAKAIPTTSVIRDAEAMEMFPQFAGAQPLGLPAPSRPTRGDFQPAQLDHQVDVPLDLGAFDGGYDTEESRLATRVEEEPAQEKKKAARKKAARKKAEPAGQTAGQDRTEPSPEEGTDSDNKPDKAVPYEPVFPIPDTVPRNMQEWQDYAERLIEFGLPKLGTADAINAERRAHQEMIDAAPGSIGDKLADAFADALTDLV